MSANDSPKTGPARGAEPKLGRRAARASAWTAAEVGIRQILRLANNLIMTRLLLPEAFGLMAMVVTVQAGLVMLTDLGVNVSIVQSDHGDEPEFLRVAWLVQAMRGAAIAGLVALAGVILWLVAPQIAPEGTVYADPRLPGLIILSSLSMVTKGLESPNQFLAQRRLQLSRLVALGVSSQIIALASMIAFAAINPTVWALLLGMLVGSATRMVLSHMIFEGPRMRIEWNREMADELWHFGKWILLSSAFGFLANNADRLILGALLDKETFGLYTIAFTWIQAAGMLLQRISSRIGTSAFGEIRRTAPERIAGVFRRFTAVMDVVVIAGLLAATLGGRMLIHLLYSPAYATAGIFMPFLALFLANRHFDPLGSLLLSRADSKSMMWVAAVRAASICILVPLGFSVFGIEGALMAKALSPIAGVPVLLNRARPILGDKILVDRVWLAAIPVVAVIIYLAYSPI